MRRFLFLSVVVSSLACGGMMEGMNLPPMPGAEPAVEPAPSAAEPAPAPAGGGATGGNAAACRKYIDTLNNLPCMSAMPKQDAATVCPDALDQMGCDVSKYYTCMSDNSKCNGAIPDMAGIANCGSPTCQ